MQELVSVIVPIYNVEDYLEQCVTSIQNQTYKNLEIILVDDGSPDRCGEICERMALQDSRIKVLHKVNGGLSDARNAGIEIASGDYFLFIDSDDWIHVQMIEVLVALVKKADAKVSICNYQYVHEGKEYSDNKKDCAMIVSESECIDGIMAQKIYFEEEKKRIYYTVAWNKLYHRSLFAGVRYPKGKVHEDEYTTYKLLYKADKIQVTEETLYYYLVRNNSIMGNFKQSRFDAIGGYLEKVHSYVDWNQKTLAGKMLIHSIRMLAQYKKWMDEERVDYSQALQEYRSRIRKCYTFNKENINVSFLNKLEIWIFNISFELYYRFWGLKKR